VWRINSSAKRLYLTFDDGPIPTITPWVLEQLATYGAKATFFCVGDNIRKHPALFEQLKQQKHSIGNHTYHHLDGWRTSFHDYMKDVQKCQALTKTNLFRPPYGRLSPRQALALQKTYKIVMWEVLAGDFDTQMTAEACIQNITKVTVNGSIIVLHDSQKAWPRLQKTLPFILDYYTKRGFDFCGVSTAATVG